MATTNDLFAQAIKETKHLHCSEVLLVRDLFKGYEWNRISRRDRLYLETLFLKLYLHFWNTFRTNRKSSSGQQKYKVKII